MERNKVLLDTGGDRQDLRLTALSQDDSDPVLHARRDEEAPSPVAAAVPGDADAALAAAPAAGPGVHDGGLFLADEALAGFDDGAPDEGEGDDGSEFGSEPGSDDGSDLENQSYGADSSCEWDGFTPAGEALLLEGGGLIRTVFDDDPLPTVEGLMCSIIPIPRATVTAYVQACDELLSDTPTVVAAACTELAAQLRSALSWAAAVFGEEVRRLLARSFARKPFHRLHVGVARAACQLLATLECGNRDAALALKLAELHPTDAQVSLRACEIVARWASQHQPDNELWGFSDAFRKATASVHTILQQHLATEEVVAAACSALRVLSAVEDIPGADRPKAFCNRGEPPSLAERTAQARVLAHALERYLPNPRICSAVCSVLSVHLTAYVGATGSAPAVGAQAGAALLAALERYMSDPRLAGEACAALYMLLASVTESTVAASPVPPLRAAMLAAQAVLQHTDDPYVVTQGCYLLPFACSVLPAAQCEEVARAGGINAAVAALRHYPPRIASTCNEHTLAALTAHAALCSMAERMGPAVEHLMLPDAAEALLSQLRGVLTLPSEFESDRLTAMIAGLTCVIFERVLQFKSRVAIYTLLQLGLRRELVALARWMEKIAARASDSASLSQRHGGPSSLGLSAPSQQLSVLTALPLAIIELTELLAADEECCSAYMMTEDTALLDALIAAAGVASKGDNWHQQSVVVPETAVAAAGAAGAGAGAGGSAAATNATATDARPQAALQSANLNLRVCKLIPWLSPFARPAAARPSSCDHHGAGELESEAATMATTASAAAGAATRGSVGLGGASASSAAAAGGSSTLLREAALTAGGRSVSSDSLPRTKSGPQAEPDSEPWVAQAVADAARVMRRALAFLLQQISGEPATDRDMELLTHSIDAIGWLAVNAHAPAAASR